ncbi:hypothetical protein [Trueperella abortisuis]|uniref:hypothetical protein n=1 Tax=Trueperella abortisuis TaxID=445930 RepID=UPI002892EEF0|nr:hypothetical protein [Trueperella abortisuis]
MSNALKIRLSRIPDPEAVLAARKVRLSRRMIKRVFGTTNPCHRMAVLLPGDAADRVEVQFTRTGDDLSALADAIKSHATSPTPASVKGGEEA